jgi:hypothetical protein
MNQVSTPALSALEELNAIRAYVMDVQRQLKAGHMPDMTALEHRTADLCRIIREASSDVQKKCAPELADLVRQLDDCEQGLRAFYETVLVTPDPRE